MMTSGRWAPIVALTTMTLLAGVAMAGPYHAPRTSQGQPDLQGLWTNATLTPLERDPKFGDRLVLTPQEAAAIEGRAAETVARADAPTAAGATADEVPCGLNHESCSINSAWEQTGTRVVRVGGEAHSSILTAPADGRVPYTAFGRAHRLAILGDDLPRNDPEERTAPERCLVFPVQSGPPMLPGMYNNNLQIVQTRDHVVLLSENIHDARIVRLGGVHIPAEVRQWMGDSIGHWEGETLVVETSNLRAEQAIQGQSPAARVTERFTRIGPAEIFYRFTVEDPVAYAAPWGGELVLGAIKGPIYEYGCHEGDRGMEGILGGARYEEREAAKAAR